VSKFLLDANISPETRRYLEQRFGLDVIDLLTAQQGGLSDREVVDLAKQQGRVIITFDRDSGQIYHFHERGQLGVVVLRLEDQTVESVNAVLDRFFASEAEHIDLDHSLVIIEEDRLRIIGSGPLPPD